MAWTETTRPKYERKSARYQSDLTDAEWALLAGLFSGCPRKWPLREMDTRKNLALSAAL